MSDYDELLKLIGTSSIVLIGEASHGTHELYKSRADITRRLIQECGFNVVAAEADWPDSWMVNSYIKGQGSSKSANEALSGFQRFPTWMWRNADVLAFVEWLKKYNDSIPAYDDKVGFYGLDLYSLYRSAFAVVDCLNAYDPQSALRARELYSCLWSYGPTEQHYGYAASLGLTKTCEENVIKELTALQSMQSNFLKHDGRLASDDHFFAEQNARVVANAQAYYREMFRGRVSTWNLRDSHMVDTLFQLRKHLLRNGQHMKAVVWAHNSHLGDARATEMGSRGEHNIGQLVREHCGNDCKLIGFSTFAGTVTASSSWAGTAERKTVNDGLYGSYEHLFNTVDLPAFQLDLGQPEISQLLSSPRLQRAIGVIYLPQTERISHYFAAKLSEQFDMFFHFQETQAVEPMEKTSRWVSGDDRVEQTID